MTKKAIILYTVFYDLKNDRVLTGGIQTYISSLIDILRELDYEVIVVQCGNNPREIAFSWGKLQVIANPGWHPRPLLKYAQKIADVGNDLLIFADDALAKKNRFRRSVSIQHGIAWDKPCHRRFPKLLSDIWVFKKSILGYKKIRALHCAKAVVCVDNNFINWYRAMVAYPSVKLKFIPNFASSFCSEKNKCDKYISIIFARRFVWYRGTRIFLDAIRPIMEAYPNVRLTIAGRGEDEQLIKKSLEGYADRVKMINFDNKESVSVHSKHDIAVIPTIGSEGTSLSLLEAMAAKCAVICTNVGGMTNIVIDGFNGLLINPDSASLYDAVERLINDVQLRDLVSSNAFQTVMLGFSFEKWKEKWKSLLLEVGNL